MGGGGRVWVGSSCRRPADAAQNDAFGPFWGRASSKGAALIAGQSKSPGNPNSTLLLCSTLHDRFNGAVEEQKLTRETNMTKAAAKSTQPQETSTRHGKRPNNLIKYV